LPGSVKLDIVDYYPDLVNFTIKGFISQSLTYNYSP